MGETVDAARAREGAQAVLTPETILVRAPSLVVRFGDAHEVTIELDGKPLRAPPSATSILEAFAAPTSVGDALGRLAPTGPEQFVELSSAIVMLARAGVLEAPGAPRRAPLIGFVRPTVHIAMLDDRARTGAFCRALAAVVRPGDVAVDIGTGTGVLAVAAARAGARRVYAVEESGIAATAARVFEANGVADRVTVVHARSTHADLPEPANVLVTETIGDDPLDEGILEIVADARRRFLAPGARVVPRALELFAVPVDMPEELVRAQAFDTAHVEAWKAAYGVDLAPLLAHRLAATQPIVVPTRDAARWPRLAPPVLLRRVDLEAPVETTFTCDARVTLEGASANLGIAVLFRATLADGIVVSTLPGEAAPDTCWRWATWPAVDCLQNARGTAIEVAVDYARTETAVRARRA